MMLVMLKRARGFTDILVLLLKKIMNELLVNWKVLRLFMH